MAEPITDEKLAEIEAGLEGVTPGPWRVYRDGTDICEESGHLCGCEFKADAAHIARLDPDTVRSLLARLTAAEAEAARLREALTQITAWKQAVEIVAPELGGLLKAIYNAEAVLASRPSPAREG